MVMHFCLVYVHVSVGVGAVCCVVFRSVPARSVLVLWRGVVLTSMSLFLLFDWICVDQI